MLFVLQWQASEEFLSRTHQSVRMGQGGDSHPGWTPRVPSPRSTEPSASHAPSSGLDLPSPLWLISLCPARPFAELPAFVLLFLWCFCFLCHIKDTQVCVVLLFSFFF